MIYSYLWQWNKSWTPLTPIIKFQQLNSELSYMKPSQEVSKSDLQAVKIRLGHFLEMFHVWQLRIKLLKFYNGSQWGLWFIPLSQIGINHCFGNKSKLIPHTDSQNNAICDECCYRLSFRLQTRASVSHQIATIPFYWGIVAILFVLSTWHK